MSQRKEVVQPKTDNKKSKSKSKQNLSVRATSKRIVKKKKKKNKKRKVPRKQQQLQEMNSINPHPFEWILDTVQSTAADATTATTTTVQAGASYDGISLVCATPLSVSRSSSSSSSSSSRKTNKKKKRQQQQQQQRRSKTKPKKLKKTKPFKTMTVDWNQDRAIVDGQTMTIQECVDQGYMNQDGSRICQTNGSQSVTMNFF